MAQAVQDWIARRGFKTLYIQPGNPWQDADSESFHSRFRDEFLNRETFASVLEAKVLAGLPDAARRRCDETQPAGWSCVSNDCSPDVRGSRKAAFHEDERWVNGRSADTTKVR